MHYNNFFQKDGSTALMFACQNNNLEAVRILLQVANCHADARDKVCALLHVYLHVYREHVYL